MGEIEFDKYVAAGNDFLIFDGAKIPQMDYNKLALQVCNRHFGLGCDGIMICMESQIADVKMLYYNSDGSQGEMCGNGIRSFSKYVYEHNISRKKNLSIETLAGIKYVDISTDSRDKLVGITVDMGLPVFQGKMIPINLDKDMIIEETISVDKKEYSFSALSVGVPHVVIFVDSIDKIDINDLGRKIENHPLFPKKANVNFVEVSDRARINIYTWERGAGRTLGCGTGSCAAVVIGNILNKLDKKVCVKTEGGKLEVELGDNFQIFMTGNASHIARGNLIKAD